MRKTLWSRSETGLCRGQKAMVRPEFMSPLKASLELFQRSPETLWFCLDSGENIWWNDAGP